MPDAPTEIDVVVRCRNEMPYTARALEALAAQRGVVARVLFLDCGSTDGSREIAVAAGVRVLDEDPKAYRPGAVLNRGMKLTRSPLVAFVNADAVAQDAGALARLVAPFEDRPEVAASFGRQLPRPEAAPWTRVEYARAFGASAPVDVRHGAFFSMVASVVRRAVWERVPFSETLRFSEDVDWTSQLRALGWRVAYAPDAVFEHSHDYDLGAQFRRRKGEGVADRAIHGLGAPSLATDLVRPFAGMLLRDLAAGLVAPTAVGIRAAQAAGYFVGRRGA